MTKFKLTKDYVFTKLCDGCGRRFERISNPQPMSGTGFFDGWHVDIHNCGLCPPCWASLEPEEQADRYKSVLGD